MKKLIYSILVVASVTMVSCGEEKVETTPEIAPVDTVVVAVDTVPVFTLPMGWEETETPAIHYLAVKDSVLGSEMATLSAKLGADYGKVMTYLKKNKLTAVGAPIVHWQTWDTTTYSVFMAAIPVAEGTVGKDKIVLMTIPAGPAMKYVHTGSYETMEAPHIAINEYFMQSATAVTGGPWEIYITDPMTEADTTKWISEIWYPLAPKM